MMEKEYLKKLDIIRSTKILLNKNKTKRTSFNSLTSDIQFQVKQKFDEFTKYSPKLKSLREEIDKWYDSHRVKGPNNKSYQSKLDFYQKQTNDMLLNVFIKEVKSAKISSVKIATDPDIQRKHKKINLSRRANNDKALLRLSENAAHELEIYVNSLEAELSKIAWDFEKGLEENGRN